MYTEINGIRGSKSWKYWAQQQLKRFGTSNESFIGHQKGLYFHYKFLSLFFVKSAYYTGSSFDIITETGKNDTLLW